MQIDGTFLRQTATGFDYGISTAAPTSLEQYEESVTFSSDSSVS